ncbi:hypothetical protein [Deinococcus sp.]|uniref:hypothetical protein n=1 Tax=Deinococcus sp. TaxID=47478 RepID=UPI003C79B0E6
MKVAARTSGIYGPADAGLAGPRPHRTFGLNPCTVLVTGPGGHTPGRWSVCPFNA